MLKRLIQFRIQILLEHTSAIRSLPFENNSFKENPNPNSSFGELARYKEKWKDYHERKASSMQNRKVAQLVDESDLTRR
jgi:hypothetical protein